MRIEELTKSQRWKLSELLAEDRLKEVNKTCIEVCPKTGVYVKYIKRVLDIVISLLVLVISLPFNLLIGIITFFDVGNPIFFLQTRVGKDGNIFRIIKFRNMKNTKDERGELLPPDKRVTKFGRFVRKTSLDELLNFWSILKGDMSLIGPRPLVPEYEVRYSNRHKMRTSVKPGLECPPRTFKGYDRTWQWQFENDIWYVENVSFLVDCFLCIQMFRLVFDKKSIALRSRGKRDTFAGYDLNGNAIGYDKLTQEELAKFEKELINV